MPGDGIVRRRSSLPIIALLIGIVAVVAVAGAFVLTSNGPTGGNDGTDDTNDGNDSTDDNGTDTVDNTTTVALRLLDLKVGDFVEYAGEVDILGLKQPATIRLTVTEVTASDYEIKFTMTGAMNQEGTYRASSIEELIAGLAGEPVSHGTFIGDEVLGTPYGDKQVAHWRSNTATDAANNETEYYLGNDTGMVYKVAIRSVSTDLLHITTTTTAVLSGTNIEKIKSGDRV